MRVYSERRTLQPFASASRSAGVAQLSAEYAVDNFTTASLLVNLTAISGSPSAASLDVKIQFSPDTSGSLWIDLPNGAITQLTSTGRQLLSSVDLGTARRIRVSYTLAFTGGTSPTATFGVYIAFQQNAPNNATFTGSVSVSSEVEVKNDSGSPVPTLDTGAYQTVTLQNAATATGNGSSIALSGMGTMNVAVTGTFVGTVTFEAQDASGAWNAVMLQSMGTTTLASSTTTTGVWRAPIGGYAAFRARISAYTSGSITVSAFAENTAYTPAVQNVGIYEKLDATNDSITSYPLGHSQTYISTATTTTIKTGAGVLHTIVLGETAAGTITIYDNTAGSGTVIGVLKASIAEQTFTFNCAFATGLTIVTAGASKLTVNWR